MKVKIIDSEEGCWYTNSIGKVFDVKIRTHPTFKYKEYILLNTDENKKHFINDNLSLLILKSGHHGVQFEHGEAITD